MEEEAGEEGDGWVNGVGRRMARRDAEPDLAFPRAFLASAPRMAG